MKYHLRKAKGNVASCKLEPNDVRLMMENSLNKNVQKAKKKKKKKGKKRKEKQFPNTLL